MPSKQGKTEVKLLQGKGKGNIRRSGKRLALGWNPEPGNTVLCSSLNSNYKGGFLVTQASLANQNVQSERHRGGGLFRAPGSRLRSEARKMPSALCVSQGL